MKSFIISIVLVASTMVCNAQQALLGMSPVFSFSPSPIVTHGTSVTLKAYVKNKSNVLFVGNIDIKAKVDTSTQLGVPCGSDSLQNVSMPPQDSLEVTLTFTPQPGPGAFNLVNCCVTPIIVWPYVSLGNGIVLDTLECGLQIVSTVGVKELIKKEYKVYPSPTKDVLYIKHIAGSNPTSIVIYDLYGQKVKDVSYSETISVSDLSPGCYWLSIKNSENKTHEQLLLKE